jgi:uncharacterized protein HemX
MEEGKTVKRDANLLLGVIAVGIAIAFAIAPRTEGQSQRGECQQRCTQQYQDRKSTRLNSSHNR